MAIPQIGPSNLAQMSDSNRRALQNALGSGTQVFNWSPAQVAALRAYNSKFGTTLGGVRAQPGYTTPTGTPAVGGGGVPGGGGPAVGGGGRGGAPAGVFRASGSFENIDDIIGNDAALGWVLTQAGIPGATLQEQLRNAYLGSTFSGIDQWRRNLTGQTVQEGGADTYANNVGFDLDVNTLRRIVGEITSNYGKITMEKIRDAWQQRLGGTGEGGYQGVPEWAPGSFRIGRG